MKICIGTANYKKLYGLNKIRVKANDVAKITKYLKKNKIKFIDTANNYNNADIFLKEKGFKIIIKISKLRNIDSKNIKHYINKQIKPFFNKKNKIYAVLLHDCRDMFSMKKFEIFKCLLNLNKKKTTHKIGISCYNEEDLLILKKFKFDIVQFPFNIFDQRILKKKNLNIIKDTELHVRSIFLQGLLLKKNPYLQKKFKRWKPLFKKFEIYLKKKKITNLEACLYFIKKFKIINKIIVGIENAKQLDEVFKILKSNKGKNLNFDKFKSSDKKLILPINWNN